LKKFQDVAIVTVRNSSSRLPNKAIMKIKGNLRSIDIVIERAKQTGLTVILATSTDNSDDIFDSISKEHDIELFRGALLNKINRWKHCFEKFDIQNALLLDGDDLCHNYDIGKRAIFELKSKSIDMIMNPPGIVTGFFTYAINRTGINKMFNVAPYPEIDTDVITRYIEKADLKTDFVVLEDYEINEKIRMTLDYEEDLCFFQELYKKMDILENGKTIIDFLKNNPKILEINFHKQKDFLNNQKEFNDNIE
jgi:spore coat polysaccharide biosynthesis protein SpsF (cytidylyltransferase family)